MNRRDFFTNGSAGLLAGHMSVFGGRNDVKAFAKGKQSAKNIIFMVSDGMSTGTLNMADLLLKRKQGQESAWMKLYSEQAGRRAFMETSSSSALVTDSAAGSSAWGGGRKVPNGNLNVNADGSFNKPILQKFKEAGKSVGCVTSVTITHATPAGFCINNKSRGDESEIAAQYLDLKFDVMMGGGAEFFLGEKRKDKVDLFTAYEKAGYVVARNRDAMLGLNSAQKPIMGIFCEGALPYSLDTFENPDLQKTVPTLAEMTRKTLDLLSKNQKGFAVQIEGGKVDWAAHSNDAGGLLYDQIAFDQAIQVALDFATKDKETLVIITTDHGNANPGLFGGDKQFDLLQKFRHTNNWILGDLSEMPTTSKLIERIEFAQGYAIKKAEAEKLLGLFGAKNESGLYIANKPVFRELALIQSHYTGIGWAGMDHSADYVELAMFGPGSEKLSPFVKNTDLHNFMLDLTGIARV
ncbi:alkaline phosphatase [Dyadobacter chenwenxiniae]|uniref:Alkaline phosphatase n=1 Tax=Dyadobacter chenwenxiniae TaxID=2906456 RepID=A0A9X1PLU9_9BACT|nr:alkaline phosphatase [Dyadobacter chenwenxiniae]MCF0063757.1 alkaline phosphatase [Dyadobacter chenwenxiniae]UON83433.1 alkaline phosphatase [Dyadobacter chenwenxiniae]